MLWWSSYRVSEGYRFFFDNVVDLVFNLLKKLNIYITS